MSQPNSLENPQFNNSQEVIKTSEELTAEFFTQNYDVLAEALVGKTLITDANPSAYAIIEQTTDYSRSDNENARGPEVSHYRNIINGVIPEGKLYVAESKRNPNGRLLLIPARDGENGGACVAIDAAQIAHPKKGAEITKAKAQIASALELIPGEYTLQIREPNANTIYIMVGKTQEAQPDAADIIDANEFFDQL